MHEAFFFDYYHGLCCAMFTIYARVHPLREYLLKMHLIVNEMVKFP